LSRALNIVIIFIYDKKQRIKMKNGEFAKLQNVRGAI